MARDGKRDLYIFGSNKTMKYLTDKGTSGGFAILEQLVKEEYKNATLEIPMSAEHHIVVHNVDADFEFLLEKIKAKGITNVGVTVSAQDAEVQYERHFNNPKVAINGND